MDKAAWDYLAALPPEEREAAEVWLEEMEQMGATTLEEARGIDHAMMIGDEESEMGRLLAHVTTGKSISRNDLARVIRATLHVEIPKEIRLVIADLLDDSVKTGRMRRHAYFTDCARIFKNSTIRAKYKELRAQKVSSQEAIKHLAESWRMHEDSITNIIKKSKVKS